LEDLALLGLRLTLLSSAIIIESSLKLGLSKILHLFLDVKKSQRQKSVSVGPEIRKIGNLQTQKTRSQDKSKDKDRTTVQAPPTAGLQTGGEKGEI